MTLKSQLTKASGHLAEARSILESIGDDLQDQIDAASESGNENQAEALGEEMDLYRDLESDISNAESIIDKKLEEL